MASKKRSVITNQVFVGLPWKNVREKYDRIIPELEKKYPLYFTIVGKNDGQDAQQLFDIIKDRISSSSSGIFDATGGNPNVSLEFGYAEGIELPRTILLSDHKASKKGTAGGPIISDLHGVRRLQYKTEATLHNHLSKISADHPYRQRFEKTIVSAFRKKAKGEKKSGRSLALKIIRQLDGKPEVRRVDLVQNLKALGYGEKQINELLKKLHNGGVIKCEVGRYPRVHIA